FGAFWQIFERSQNALQFRIEVFLPVFREISQGNFQNVSIRPRSDRQSALAVEQIERSLFKAHSQLTALENAPVLIAQYRQQNFIAKIGLQRLAVDIEIRRVSGAGPIFEHVHPPLIERFSDSHVVRDKVEYLTHRMRMELPDPRFIILARADRRVEFVVVGDVVAVQAVRVRLKIRRCIHVTDSQRVEIGDDLACLRKSEPPIELQSVSAGWNAWMDCGLSCNFLSFRAKSRNPVAKPNANSAGSLALLRLGWQRATSSQAP